MAEEGIIIVKENPGSLKIEVYDKNGARVDSVTCPGIRFSRDAQIDIDGAKFKPRPSEPFGDAIVIKVVAPAGG